MYAVQPAMAEENKIGYIDAQRVLMKAQRKTGQRPTE